MCGFRRATEVTAGPQQPLAFPEQHELEIMVRRPTGSTRIRPADSNLNGPGSQAVTGPNTADSGWAGSDGKPLETGGSNFTGTESESSQASQCHAALAKGPGPRPGRGWQAPSP